MFLQSHDHEKRKVPALKHPGGLAKSQQSQYQLSNPYMTTGKTIALTRWTFRSFQNKKKELIPQVERVCPEADLFHSTQHNPRDSWAISCTSNIHQHGPFWCTGMWDRKMVRGFSPCCQLPPHSHINQVNFSWKSRGGKPCHLALSSVQLLSHVRIFATP